MVEINYPFESLFYPYVLILLIIIVMSIVLIVYFFLWLRHTTKRAFPLSIENHISLATLVVTVLVVFIPFLVQTPIIDYSISGPYNTTEPNVKDFKIVVHNYGIITANNVIISMNADGDGIRFLGFTSDPFLPNSTASISTLSGAFQIEVLPPRAENTITSQVSINKNDTNLTTYIRSDEAVGYHDTVLTLVVYVIVLSIILPLAIGKLKPWTLSNQTSTGKK